MKKTYPLISLFIVFALLLAVVPAQAATPEYFSFQKDCNTGTCVIYAADPFTVLVGGWIDYATPNFTNEAGFMKQTSAITIHASNGATLSGVVSWVYHNGVFQGRFDIQSGTGTLEGVHAFGTISALESGKYDLTGEYFVAP